MQLAHSKTPLPSRDESPALQARRAPSRVGYERSGFAFLLNAPALIALVLLAAYPILSSGWISLHKYSLKRPRIFAFVGLGNFRELLASDEFWSALWVTLKFTGLVVALVISLGLLIALLLNRRFPRRARAA